MRIDGRLEFRAPETSASSSCILSNTMADPVDDFNELFLFTGTQPSAVHRKLSNEYQNFVNVFCFMNGVVETVSISCRKDRLSGNGTLSYDHHFFTHGLYTFEGGGRGVLKRVLSVHLCK